jgi:hypothetical protein
MKNITLRNVIRAQPGWFSEGNKHFFSDNGYTIITSHSGKPYLVRLTSKWSDMFGQPKKYVYFINSINLDTLKIEAFDGLNDFDTLAEAKDYLETI